MVHRHLRETRNAHVAEQYLLAMTPEPMADWFPKIMRWVYSCANSLASPFFRPNGHPFPRRIFGIDPVQIERDVIADGAASCKAEGLLHHRAHTAFVNVAHGKEIGRAHV